MCDRNAKDALNKIKKRDRMKKVKFYGNNALMKGEMIMSRDVKEVVRIEHTSDQEMKQAQAKLKQNSELYDIEARNIFRK